MIRCIVASPHGLACARVGAPAQSPRPAAPVPQRRAVSRLTIAWNWMILLHVCSSQQIRVTQAGASTTCTRRCRRRRRRRRRQRGLHHRARPLHPRHLHPRRQLGAPRHLKPVTIRNNPKTNRIEVIIAGPGEFRQSSADGKHKSTLATKVLGFDESQLPTKDGPHWQSLPVPGTNEPDNTVGALTFTTNWLEK
jgi:hypothetical protein